MSYGAMSTQSMAFTNITRSLAESADTKAKSSTTNGKLNAAFGGRTVPWGSSIWSGGPLNSSQSASTAARDIPVLRDVAQQPLAHSTKTVEGKTGSGSLVDSSVCDEYATRQMWGQNSISPSSRRIPQSRYSDNLLSQQRGFSIAGMSQSNTSMSTDTAMSHAPRPPAVNLNSTVPAQAKPSFGSAFQAGMSGRSNESAPFHVYTKFDRPPNDPNANSMSKKSDSPIGSWEHVSTTPSPSDERRPQCPIQYNNGRTASFPISSNGSDPPSRHTDQKPVWASLQYSRTSQRETPDTSRTSSISSARNQAYNAHLQANSESISMQLGNFSFGAEGRTGTYGRRSLAETSAESALVPDAVPYYRNDASRSGSIAEVPGPSRNHLILDEYNFPQQANGYGPRPSSSYAGRFLQSGCALEFRPGQPYQGNPINSRSYALPGAAMSDFSNYMSGSSPSSRRSPRLAEQQPCIDPRIQHFMDAQFRNAYSNVYNPYAVQNNLQLNAPPPYLGMLPINMTMNGNGFSNSLVRESAAGEGVQSALMYEFKSNTKSKRYELHEIYDHIAEFSGDQHGSRFIQTKLETANSDEKERVFREIQPNAIPLMTDVFGNYVIQKFFEHGDQTHKKILANKMRGHVLQLSLQMYGCRVVQKALDHVLVDQQAVLIGELEKHVTKCVKDQNGNHVVQKAIERCPPATIGFIIAAFRGQVQQLSIHAYGCRVIQRCLEKCDLPSKAMIMSELLDAIPTMIFDQFGNYVVQHMVVYDDGEGRRRVLRTVGASLENYSKHKFASNVVEKCLERADDAWRHNVVLMLGRAQQAPRRIDMPRESEGSLVNLIKDNFGNYVIQKLLDTLSRDDYFLFLDVLHPAMTQAKRTGCGKQVLSIEKKMHRFEDFRNGGVSSDGFHYQVQPMPGPMPTLSQFVSHYTSAATTPPPLTADTQSLQSSRVPSVNGDTIEGASAGRKGSEQSNEYYRD